MTDPGVLKPRLRVVGEETEGWPEAQPITCWGPTWPRDVLPELEPWIERKADELQVPVSMMAATVLAGVSAITQRRLQVKISETYTEPMNLYVMVVAAPGELKTATLTAVREPIEGIQHHERLLVKDRHDEWKREMAVAKTRRDAWLKRCAGTPPKGMSALDVEEAYKNACLRVAALEASRPRLPNMFVDDATPEALSLKWHDQDGVLAGLASEGALLENVLGRYSTGQQPNLNGMLKAWDGAESVDIDRVSYDNTIRILRPYLTLGLLVQPRMLDKLGNNADAVGKGFVPRFLFVLPRSRVGERVRRQSVSWEGVVTWKSACNAINDALATIPIEGAAYSMPLTLDAVEVLDVAWARWERERRPDGSHAAIVEWSSKLASQALRVAGQACVLRSVLRGGERQWQVTGEDMARGIRLADWATDHARAAFNTIGIATSTDAGLLHLLGRFLLEFLDRGHESLSHADLAGRLKVSRGGPFRGKGGSELVARLALQAETLSWLQVAGREEVTLTRRSYVINPGLAELRSTFISA